MPYEERQKNERKAADAALKGIDILEELKKTNPTINPDDWDF